MRTPYNFFYVHAGYSYNPQTETEAQGRARGLHVDRAAFLNTCGV